MAKLANTIEKSFESHLFRGLNSWWQEIRAGAKALHSWDVVGEATRTVYEELLGRHSS